MNSAILAAKSAENPATRLQMNTMVPNTAFFVITIEEEEEGGGEGGVDKEKVSSLTTLMIELTQ